jgi:hypothetical protein
MIRSVRSVNVLRLELRWTLSRFAKRLVNEKLELDPLESFDVNLDFLRVSRTGPSESQSALFTSDPSELAIFPIHRRSTYMSFKGHTLWLTFSSSTTNLPIFRTVLSLLLAIGNANNLHRTVSRCRWSFGRGSLKSFNSPPTRSITRDLRVFQADLPLRMRKRRLQLPASRAFHPNTSVPSRQDSHLPSS